MKTPTRYSILAFLERSHHHHLSLCIRVATQKKTRSATAVLSFGLDGEYLEPFCKAERRASSPSPSLTGSGYDSSAGFCLDPDASRGPLSRAARARAPASRARTWLCVFLVEQGFLRAKLNHRVDAHESNESEHDVQVGHFAARASDRVARGGAYAELDEINQSSAVRIALCDLSPFV